MKPKRVLGLDIGSCTFKLVLLELQDSRPVLTHARLLEVPAQAEPNVRQAALQSLLEGIDRNHLSGLVSVLDDPFTCVQKVLIPPMPAGEVADAVKWELQRFLAVPPEEVAVAYRLLGQQEVDGVKKQRLLAVALPSAAIREHLAFLAQAGLHPTTLIPKTSALSAWLTRGGGPKSAQEPVGILEIGGGGCELIVAENGEAVFSRKISCSATGLTKEMTGVLMTDQGQVSLTEAEAETVKRSVGIPPAEAAGLGMRGVSGMQIFSLIRGSLERLAVETERSIAFYSESSEQEAVKELFLVGGGAHLKGLAEWLRTRLGVQVAVPKTLDGVVQLPGALQSNAAAMELSLAAALGAALGAGKGMNLLPLELQESLQASIQRAALKAAVTGGLLGAVLLWSGLQVYHHSLMKQIGAFDLEQKAVAQQIPAVRAAAVVRERWGREPDWEEVFRFLTHQVPPEAYLTALVVDGQEMTLRGRIRKLGRSADEVLAQFTQTLGSGLLNQVRLHSSRQLEQSQDLAEFEIGGHLR